MVNNEGGVSRIVESNKSELESNPTLISRLGLGFGFGFGLGPGRSLAT